MKRLFHQPARFRAFLGTLAQAARWQAALALLLSLLFSLTEGVGVSLLIPTLEVAGFHFERGGTLGRYAHYVAAAAARLGIPPTVPALLAVFIAVVGVRAVMQELGGVVPIVVMERVAAQLRVALYGAICEANWLFICRKRGSDLTHALASEVERAALAAYELLNFAGEITLAALYTAIALWLSAPMTVLVLGSALALVLLLRGWLPMLEQRGFEVSDESRLFYASAAEHVANLKTVKAYGAESREAAAFDRQSRRVSRALIVTSYAQARLSLAFELGSLAALGAAVYASLRLLRVPAPAVLILLLLFARLMPRFKSAYHHYRSLVSLLPSYQNVCELTAQCRAEAEPRPADGVPALPPAWDKLALDGVGFSYNGGSTATLDGISLELRAGEIAALAGSSGAGKSTIAELVMGLLRPESGRILLDGRELDPAQVSAMRKCTGYVGQETFLFHDTIRNNLLWASPGAGEPEMRKALRLAECEELVRGLPHGLDTVVGDRGLTVSAGERQRLALARALLRRPALLILDEATNNLDTENETQILDAIDKLRQAERLAVLLIAHRPSTLRWAGQIHVIENGHVVESGNWDSLGSRPGGRLRALYSADGSPAAGSSGRAKYTS